MLKRFLSPFFVNEKEQVLHWNTVTSVLSLPWENSIPLNVFTHTLQPLAWIRLCSGIYILQCLFDQPNEAFVACVLSSMAVGLAYYLNDLYQAIPICKRSSSEHYLSFWYNQQLNLFFSHRTDCGKTLLPYRVFFENRSDMKIICFKLLAVYWSCIDVTDLDRTWICQLNTRKLMELVAESAFFISSLAQQKLLTNEIPEGVGDENNHLCR